MRLKEIFPVALIRITVLVEGKVAGFEKVSEEMVQIM